MSADTLLGGYVAASTPVHRLDARVKLALLVASTASLFAAGPAAVALFALECVLAARLARVSARSVVAGVRPALFILAFMLLANVLTLDGTGDVNLVGSLGLS